jgi:hypothetical protein
MPAHTDCVTTFAPPPRKRGGKGSRIDTVREQVVDIDHALTELAAARAEMAAVPDGLNKHQRETAMLEPMGRIQLVVKFCEGVLKQNGWKREPSR